MTEVADFQMFRDTAEPGQRLIYYRGFLGEDAQYLLKEAVSAAYLSGWFDLTQRRLASRKYEYIVTRRSVRDPVYRTWTIQAEKGGRDTHYQGATQ